MLAGCLVGQRRCGVGWLLSESAAMRCWLVAQSVGGGAVLAGFSVSQRRAGRFVKTSSIHPWRLRRVIPDAEALLRSLLPASLALGVFVRKIFKSVLKSILLLQSESFSGTPAG